MPEDLTDADRVWFDLPVTARVEPDNQRWLDTLMEMKKEELINYAVYNYSIPVIAIEALATQNLRSDMIQMIITANAAGESGMTADHKYRYLPDIPDEVPTAVSRKEKPLYLTRGDGANIQVFVANAGTEGGEWQPYANLRTGHEPEVVEAAAKTAAANVSVSSPTNQPKAPAAPAPQTPAATPAPGAIDVGVLIPMLPKMRRADRVNIAKQMGLSIPLEPTDEYPDNDSISRAIEARYVAQGGKLPAPEVTTQQQPVQPQTPPVDSGTTNKSQEG